MQAFSEHPDFLQLDARKNRSFNPINLDTLETKLTRLLPIAILPQANVLDLGCCLGAFGQWALFHGAKYYHGVEVQPQFAKLATTLLGHWQGQFEITQQDVRSFLATQADKSYDIVVMAGMLHVFLDPKAIIDQACRIAKKVVAVESILPPLLRMGKIDPNTAVLQYCKTSNNLAGGDHQLKGTGALLSKPALDMLFLNNGFKKSPVDLIPSISEPNLAFCSAVADEQAPIRFFERYTKTDQKKDPSLEQSVVQQRGEVEKWQDSVLHKKSQRRDQLEGSWEFDRKVADNFQDIAHKHIPNYDLVIELSVELVRNYGKVQPKILDVGCATGETLVRLHQAGFAKLFGVDNSAAMLQLASQRCVVAQYAESSQFPQEFGSFDVVISNWTLHFIQDRLKYLQDIFQSLLPGGLLILTEKTDIHQLTKKLYYDFKRSRGVSELEIANKEKQIQGVLCTSPISWYLKVLEEIGFEYVDIVSARFGFVTFLAKKSEHYTVMN